MFADDEEEGDNFFGTSTKSASKPAQPKKEEKAKPRSGSLFDDGEHDDEDMFSVKSKPKDSGKKKPVGGVALFGGADILKKKTEPAVEEPKQDEPEEKVPDVKPPPRKSTLSLFDADDDEGADLFGAAPKPKPAPAPAAGKKETKAKGQGKSLFKDEDLLFGGATEEAPDVDLFSQQGPLSSPTKSEPPKPAATKAPPPASKPTVKVGGATTKSSSTDLFDDEDDEDLFGSGKKEKAKDKMEVKGATVTESSDSGPLTGDEEPKAPPAVVTKKKPAGAVSMFGGMDPSALLKKKKPVEKEEEKPQEDKKTEEKKKTVDPLFGDDEDEKGEADLFTVVAPKPRPKPPAAKPKPVSEDPKPISEEPKPVSEEPEADEKPADKEKDKTPEEEAPKPSATRPKKLAGAVSMFGGINPLAGLKKKQGSLEKQDSSEGDVDVPVPPDLPEVEQGGLAINPAALLPGAAPPSVEPTPVAASFDEPVEAKTLTSANKDRARIITRRRPMSRKARQSAALSGVFEDFSPTMSPTSPTETKPIAQTDNSTSSAPKSEKRSDLFGNDDILGETSKTVPVLTQDHTGEKDLFGDGLFSGKGGKTKVADNVDGLFDSASAKSDKKPAKDEDGEDLFSSKLKAGESAKDAKVKTASPEEDDLFAVSSKPSKTSTEKAEAKAVTSESVKKEDTKKKSKVVEEEDDIFADSSINKKKESKPKTTTTDEDEIFSPSAVSKKPADPKPAADEDIFASPAPVEKKKLKKASVKDETLFKDDTDIFADIPASKPKEPKKKKKIASEKKSVFKDDIDDIFADSSPVASKSKKDTKKKTKDSGKEKAGADDGDIFDDPLGGGK